jgi:prepilin-type N-terminal cleavage/methylation domain-containing protein
MKKNGFSLIELLVVMIILGILASLGTVSFRGWIRKTELESQVKEMYTDIMNARLTAMHRNTTHLISLSTNQISGSVDTNGDGVGDNALCIWNRNKGDSADASCPSDKALSYKNLSFPATWSGATTLAFNARGLSTTNNSICVFSTLNPSYDCIVVSSTRITMGKLINQSGGCISDNCEPKK